MYTNMHTYIHTYMYINVSKSSNFYKNNFLICKHINSVTFLVLTINSFAMWTLSRKKVRIDKNKLHEWKKCVILILDQKQNHYLCISKKKTITVFKWQNQQVLRGQILSENCTEYVWTQLIYCNFLFYSEIQ